MDETKNQPKDKIEKELKEMKILCIFLGILTLVFLLCTVGLATANSTLSAHNSNLDVRLQEITSAIQANTTVSEQPAAKTAVESVATQTAKSTATPEPTNESIHTLPTGNYISGVDFKPGIYNLKVLSGYGRNESSNGSIDAMMAYDLEGYPDEFRNIDLPEGTTLTIECAKIELSLVK